MMPSYVSRLMSTGESFAHSDDGNIKRFTSGARPNSILTDKDRNRFKLLPHYRCRRQPVERDPEVRIPSWMKGLASLAAQVNRIRNETSEPFNCTVMITGRIESNLVLNGNQRSVPYNDACFLPRPGPAKRNKTTTLLRRIINQM